MISLCAYYIPKIMRALVLLAMMGELTECTQDLQLKAGQSVRTGLISLEGINNALHKKKPKK